MSFVLDASITLAWVFDDEDHPSAVLALECIRTGKAHVPGLWWYEVRNALIINERRRRLTQADTALFLRELSSLDLTIDPLPDEKRVLELSRRHSLTVYDAAYLELAERKGLPLSTLDVNLSRAARLESVLMLGESSG
jgi:predicted nucleic acid-binding protein